MVTEDTYATLALGFPELEFSRSELHGWPKEKEAVAAEKMVQPSNSSYYSGARYIDPSRNRIFLNKSCQVNWNNGNKSKVSSTFIFPQVVRPVPTRTVAPEHARNNHGLASPGAISAFLEVVDLMAGKIRCDEIMPKKWE